jgi:hypothetical protein
MTPRRLLTRLLSCCDVQLGQVFSCSQQQEQFRTCRTQYCAKKEPLLKWASEYKYPCPETISAHSSAPHRRHASVVRVAGFKSSCHGSNLPKANFWQPFAEVRIPAQMRKYSDFPNSEFPRHSDGPFETPYVDVFCDVTNGVCHVRVDASTELPL